MMRGALIFRKSDVDSATTKNSIVSKSSVLEIWTCNWNIASSNKIEKSFTTVWLYYLVYYLPIFDRKVNYPMLIETICSLGVLYYQKKTEDSDAEVAGVVFKEYVELVPPGCSMPSPWANARRAVPILTATPKKIQQDCKFCCNIL